MLHQPGELHGVWVFWEGAGREFAGWYLNLQEPPRRGAHGFDTQDLELDLVLAVGEPGYRFKDVDLLEQREREGRYTPEQVARGARRGRAHRRPARSRRALVGRGVVGVAARPVLAGARAAPGWARLARPVAR